MFLINPIEFILQFDCVMYLFAGFAFLGVFMLLQKIIWGRS